MASAKRIDPLEDLAVGFTWLALLVTATTCHVIGVDEQEYENDLQEPGAEASS